MNTDPPHKPGDPDARIDPEPDALTDLARGLREATEDLAEVRHAPPLVHEVEATEDLAEAIARYRQARLDLGDVSPSTLVAFDHLFAPEAPPAPTVARDLNLAGVATVLPDPDEIEAIGISTTDDAVTRDNLAAMIRVLGRRLQSLGFRIMFRPIAKPE